MFFEGISRPYAVGMFAAQGLMPWPVVPVYIGVFVLTSDTRPDWAWVAIVAVNAVVQLLAITGAVGMYWIPRLVWVERVDGNRVQTTGPGMLTYLALFPAVVAAVGLAYLGGELGWWQFVLGGAAWVLVVPALFDLGLRAVLTSQPSPGPEQYGSGPAGDRMPVADFGLSLPDGWVTLPEAPEPDWAQQAAAELSDIPGRRDQLADRLAAAQHTLSAQPHLMTAVWAPVAASPELAGTLTVDRIVPPEGQRVDRKDYRTLIEPDHRRRVVVFGRYIDDIDIPAGPALLVIEFLTKPTSPWKPWDKLVIKNVICTVFPPRCYEAIQLAFSTSRGDVIGNALQVDASAAIHSLSVSLGQVRSA